MATFIPCVLAFLLALNAASALKCYKCNSKDTARCAWGITSFSYDVEECTSAGFLDSVVGPKCYKITAENKDGGEYIARGCLPPATIGCSAIASAIGWVGSQSSNDADSLRNLACDTCDSDKCNSAQRLTGVTLIGLILASAIFIF
ncbi:hypothetical protein NQ315_000403 [Exocentrus adspersus]|uniref:Protein sleepless n=1 Tax=Exocentrus adspersus TaxID=1586481 RepID=A0AAV8VLC4_9CUCU|nr:hypothetical protein NQ315_000403 [Exocentrus adspersus]